MWFLRIRDFIYKCTPLQLQEFIGRGILRELTKKELENWKGPINYISHQSTIAWRTYQHCVMWDLSKAYKVVHTTDQELHLCKLVWRWEDRTPTGSPSALPGCTSATGVLCVGWR